MLPRSELSPENAAYRVPRCPVTAPLINAEGVLCVVHGIAPVTVCKKLRVGLIVYLKTTEVLRTILIHRTNSSGDE